MLIHSPAFIHDAAHPADKSGFVCASFESFVTWRRRPVDTLCSYCEQRTVEVRVQAWQWHQETTGCTLPFHM